jgi:hypothetical protein
MTQAELGAELGGWTKGAVSAAERSWDGRRVRKFDADEIARMASIFRVPVPAFFLPPEDDGATARYMIKSGGEPVPMSEHFGYVMPDLNWEADGPAGAAYQQALITTTARYAGGEAAERLGAAVGEITEPEEIKAALEGARANRDAIRGTYAVLDALLDENSLLQDALERALRGREP